MRAILLSDEGPALLRDADRDVDGVLIENLVAAPDFRDWFLSMAGCFPPPEARLVVSAVRRGARTDNGLDLLLRVEADGSAETLLVVNRLVPSLRLAQQARAETAAQSRAGVSVARLVLVRPEAAAAHAADIDGLFAAVITHDFLRALFAARAEAATGELALRLSHHALLLDRALRVGSAALAAVTQTPEDFLADYRTLLAREAPELPPGVGMIASKPETDLPLMAFAVEALPRWPFLPPMRLAHHLRDGIVSLTFYGWGPHLSELARVMEPVLSRTPFSLALAPPRRPEARSGLMIVHEVPRLDPSRPLADQESEAAAGIAAADIMRRWFAGQRPPARLWAEIAGGVRAEDRVHRFRHDLALG